MAYTATPSKSQYGHPQVHTNGAGVTEYNGGETYALKLAIDFSMADATVLFTVPMRSRVMLAYWEVVTPFTGGASSAIGLSSSQAPYTAKGSVHGGAAGDVAATLVAGFNAGTAGTSITASPKVVVLEAGSTIKFDRITSAFTAGAGYVHVELMVAG
jgi:hypothetical protein